MPRVWCESLTGEEAKGAIHENNKGKSKAEVMVLKTAPSTLEQRSEIIKMGDTSPPPYYLMALGTLHRLQWRSRLLAQLTIPEASGNKQGAPPMCIMDCFK